MLLLQFSGAVLLSAALMAADGGGPPSIAPGEILWQGPINGLDQSAGEKVFEFSPDGRSFLYYQGAPWPRLMLQALNEPASGPAPEPRMLGTYAPLAERPPRFSDDGKWAFFTARLDWKPLRPPANAGWAENALVRTAVIQAAAVPGAAGPPQEKLAPPAAAPVDSGAIFLDYHPSGQLLLIGRIAGVRWSDYRNGEFVMDLEELSLKDPGISDEVGFQVTGQALARYSWDGKSIFYSREHYKEGAPPLFRYDRASGVHEPLRREAFTGGWIAGDVEISRAQLPHLGGFGWDGFPAYFLRRSLKEPGVQFDLAEGLPLALQGALVPHNVRGERILLSSILEDRPLVVIARWSPAGFEKELALARSAPEGALDPGSPEVRGRLAQDRSRSSRRAMADPGIAPLVKNMERSLVFLPGAPIERVRVRWLQESAGPGLSFQRRIEVTEDAEGSIRVEKTIAADKPENSPVRELLVYDGKEARYTDDRGKSSVVPASGLPAELHQFSPYHLLLDPACLGHAGLRFHAAPAGTGQKGAAGSEQALVFRYLDGFHGTLFLEVRGDQVLPKRLVVPQLFSSDKLRRNLGIIPTERSVSFEDYRPVAGRQVPHRIRFDDGLNPFFLTVEELVFNPKVN